MLGRAGTRHPHRGQRGLPGDLTAWAGVRDEIYERIMTRCWNEDLQAFTQAEDGTALDAGVRLMPMVKFLSPADPKFLSTLPAVEEHLVTTMRGVAPEQPTLCRALDHPRPRRPPGGAGTAPRRGDGILVPKFAGYTERVQNQLAAANDWNVPPDQIASGPPVFSPFKLLDPLVNVSEMFINHEDVQRTVSGWEPGELDHGTVRVLARQVPLMARMARMAMSKAPAHVTLRTPEDKTLANFGKGPTVVITGAPGELLLFIAGRHEAEVELSGDDAAVGAVRAGRGGL